MSPTYLTISSPTEGIYREKGSKFIGFAFPVDSAVAALHHIEILRKAHTKARHVCFAWKLGTDGNQHRENDDGEPSGTAGKPILGRIESVGLTNVLVAVVRYFGGTLLGAAGLVRAYRAAAEDALQHATVMEHTVKHWYHITSGFDSMHLLMPLVKQDGLELQQADYAHGADLHVGVPLPQAPNFEAALVALPGVQFQLEDVR